MSNGRQNLKSRLKLFGCLLGISLFFYFLSAVDAENPPCSEGIDAAWGKSNFEEAIEIFSKCLTKKNFESSEIAFIYFQRGMAHLALGDNTGAAIDLEASIAEDPNGATSVYAYSSLAHIFGIQGSYQKAIDLFTKAIEIDDTKAPVFFERGLSYFGFGDFNRAAEDFAQGNQIQPEKVWHSIWHYLALARSGTRNLQLLKQLRVSAEDSQINKQIFDLFTNEKSVTNIIEETSNINTSNSGFSHCDILIFAAQHIIIQSKPESVLPLLKKARDFDHKNCLSYIVIQGELERFGEIE